MGITYLAGNSDLLGALRHLVWLNGARLDLGRATRWVLAGDDDFDRVNCTIILVCTGGGCKRLRIWQNPFPEEFPRRDLSGRKSGAGHNAKCDVLLWGSSFTAVARALPSIIFQKQHQGNQHTNTRRGRSRQR